MAFRAFPFLSFLALVNFSATPLRAADPAGQTSQNPATPAAAPSQPTAAASAGKVRYTQNTKALGVSIGEKTALSYLLTKPEDSKCISPSACYFHPLTTPSGLVLTDVAPDDHLHHRGAFCAWLEVRGGADKAGDFWGWGQYAPIENRIIRNTGIESVHTTADSASFTVKNDWLADGAVLIRETLQATAVFGQTERVLDLDWKFDADVDTTLPQHAFSGFVVRTRKDAAITASDPRGPVNLPAPSHLKPESDWPAKPWYALELKFKNGPAANASAGVAIVNHPANPPTAWHIVTSIGLLNPCITAPGPVVIKAGQPLRLRYRVVTFDGPVPSSALDRMAAEFGK